MKIKSIKSSLHMIPTEVPLLKHPIKRRFVFCEVETDDGVKGHGLTGGAYLPHATITAVNQEFLPVVKDMDPRDTEAIHEKVWWKMNQRSMTGVISGALSCIDIACWDIHGKATGRTVAQLLGGARDWAPTYCTLPQCGFSSTHHGNVLSQDDQWKKLSLIVEVAREVWGSA